MLPTSGGKPAFPTFEVAHQLGGSTLKASHSRFKAQLNSAQGREGGLAPAGWASSMLNMNLLPRSDVSEVVGKSMPAPLTARPAHKHSRKASFQLEPAVRRP